MSGFVATHCRGRDSTVRTLIVDGYNVIRQTPPYKTVAEDDLDAARLALISDVSAFAHGEFLATVVFDGHLNEGSDGRSHTIAGVAVIFSRFGHDADSVIEALSRSAREAGENVVVVTSDAQTQWTVLGGNVARMSSAEFAGEIRAEEAEWREHAPAGSSKGRLEDRIGADVRRRLSRWARGKE
jgi:predicted RNA-binding protein with PIN domain